MSFKTQASRTFTSLVAGALIMGLTYEGLHVAHEPPQPHTDSHEVIEQVSARLRDALNRQPVLRSFSATAGRKPNTPPVLGLMAD